MSNKARIAHARQTLKAYRANHPDYKNSPDEPDRQALVDLLADCLHLAQAEHGNATAVIGDALNHFEAENEESKIQASL